MFLVEGPTTKSASSRLNLSKLPGKIAGRLRRILCSRRLQRLVDTQTPEVCRLGTAHGGWTLPSSYIAHGRTAVLVGAGEDISFDVELNKRGMRVFTLDPTPRAIKHVRKVLSAAASHGPSTCFYDLKGFDKQRLTLLEVGLWNENTKMRFFAPKEAHHVSHSIVNLQHTDQWFEAECMTLRSVCQSERIHEIDVLKLDIEGAEYVVLKDVVDSGLKPKAICVEFDEIRNPLKSGYLGRISGAIQLLKNAGYRLRH
jgi:FkbM family methyltransferase